jgi:transposase
MVKTAKNRSDLNSIPMLGNESLYVGVDIGKQQHFAGFVSNTLLKRHEHFEACPALKFDQSREGFMQLIDRIQSFCPLEQCFVLMEKTGHYHKALEQYLLELDISVYVMHVQERQKGMLKTDKRDALTLANHLYNQLEKGIQVADKKQLVRRAFPPTETAAQLKSLTRHRYELIQESTQRKNKLTAICDELFPELTQIYKNPNLPSALALREAFPTPLAVATASRSALYETRARHRPSNDDFVLLQQLASQSIGTKDVNRQRGLIFEQTQLIKELKLLQEHLEQIDSELCRIVEQSREGKILMSMQIIGPIQAAMIIAAIGTIANFENAADLKSYFGWAPIVSQTGKTFDRSSLTHTGTRTIKQVMFLVVANAIRMDTEWAKLYTRLVPLKCSYNERTRSYKGKVKVFGRIAGQIIEMIYAFLKKDHEVLSKVPLGEKPPDPTLYDPEIHKQHREGNYRPLKSLLRPETIVLLSEQSS